MIELDLVCLWMLEPTWIVIYKMKFCQNYTSYKEEVMVTLIAKKHLPLVCLAGLGRRELAKVHFLNLVAIL